mgnify:CR=1 FL=1
MAGTMSKDELQLELERLRLKDKENERRHEERRTSIDMRWRFAYLLVGLVGGSIGTTAIDDDWFDAGHPPAVGAVHNAQIGPWQDTGYEPPTAPPSQADTGG